MNHSDKVYKCPFCGFPFEVDDIEEGEAICGRNSFVVYQAECNHCEAVGPAQGTAQEAADAFANPTHPPAGKIVVSIQDAGWIFESLMRRDCVTNSHVEAAARFLLALTAAKEADHV